MTAPTDDGGADHLPGTAVPALALPATGGGSVAFDALPEGRTVLYVYPRAGEPGSEAPEGWDAIPGARGCTSEACSFRDHHADLARAGAGAVLGLSTQPTAVQEELVERLNLPFPILSDPLLALAEPAALGLPTFTAGGMRLYKRITLVLSGGTVEHAFYPVQEPESHAAEVLAWLQAH